MRRLAFLSLHFFVGLVCFIAPVPFAALAGAQSVAPRPQPLAGVPLRLQCDARLPFDHALLRRYPGEDVQDLSLAAGAADPQQFTSELLCGHLWEVLAGAGAHAAPADVHLPAQAVLTATLERLWVEGSRVVEQRIGSSIMPVSIPHWALAMSWRFRFAVSYTEGGDTPEEGSALRLELGGGAEQDDYSMLRVGTLLRAAAFETFADLPTLLADDGHLGDLLFALLPVAPDAPSELGLSPALAAGFWQLLATDAQQRHDALAFLLASDGVDRAGRVGLARWFVLHDPDVPLRRDALGWLLLQERDAERPGPELMQLLSWLVLQERSARMRGEAVRVVSGLERESVRLLLIAATTDEDPGVADRAASGLARSAPPTTADLEAVPTATDPPALAPWTRVFDGRVSPPRPSEEDLLPLALASRSPAGDSWLVRWLAREEDGERAFLTVGLMALASQGSHRVRGLALARMGEVAGHPEVHALLLRRLAEEPDPDLLAAALLAVRRYDEPGLGEALVAATRRSEAVVRRAAVEAMVTVPGALIDARLALLADEDPDGKVRRRARRAQRERR